MSKREREHQLPRIIEEALRTAPVRQGEPVNLLPRTSPAAPTPERVAQLLEENMELLNVIQENLAMKRLKICVKFQTRLHHNLRTLASWADAIAFSALFAANANAEATRLAGGQQAMSASPASSPAQQVAQPRSPVSSAQQPGQAAATTQPTTTSYVGLQDLVAAIFPQISGRVTESTRAASVVAGGENSNLGSSGNISFRHHPPGFSVLQSEDSILGAGNSVGLPSSAVPENFLNLETSTDRIWNALLPNSRQS